MGFNQVNGAEMYLAELEGEIGNRSLGFTDYPVRNHMTTFSGTNAVTCSAAAGTAMATGVKTRNGVLGMDARAERPLTGVAQRARAAGKRVGIATSVAINHATPGAFYAHQPDREMYYEIGTDAARAGFDFYAGSGIKEPLSLRDSLLPGIYRILQDSAYTIARGWEAFLQEKERARKCVLVQSAEVKNTSALPPALGRPPGSLTLEQITGAAIGFLNKEPEKGFFLMVEGGMIDWLCHANDGAAVIREVIDFAGAIGVAYRFYLEHPDETLIVVTADHETGGMVLGNGPYELNLKTLDHQKSSLIAITRELKKIRQQEGYPAGWPKVKESLRESCGFWGAVTLTAEEEKALSDCYHDTFHPRAAGKMVNSQYALIDPMARVAVDLLNRRAGVSWASDGHSATVVPVYAVGVGAERFSGRLDNTDIPRILSELGGY